MVDSKTVLWGQTVIYSAYVLVILLLVGWFALAITRTGKERPVKPALFYSFVAFLTVVGVSTHIVTYNTIPWAESELHRDRYTVDQRFDITVADHEFQLPSTTLQVECDSVVEFAVTSEDLTYGFGLFRPDESMVLQMQVVPGHDNEILWEFTANETLTIKSTEYSGPDGTNMTIPDAVVVSGCES